MACNERLERYLREQGVPFETQQHRRAYTAQEIAASEHIPGRQFAKVVMVVADGKPVMLVMPAPYRADVPKLAEVLNARDVRLAEEHEFDLVFPDCDRGAMRPFGNLYNVPVYADRMLGENETIVCQAGTHTGTISLRYADWKQLVQPTIATFARLPHEAAAAD